MKKIIGIIGTAVIAMAMFFNSNNANNENLDLASMISINTASAEESGAKKGCSTGNTGCATASTWCHKVSYNHKCSD